MSRLCLGIFALSLFLLSNSIPVSSQEIPVLLVVVGEDTVASSVEDDTLHVDVSLGDTIRVEFHALDWPESAGYWVTFNDGNFLKPAEEGGRQPTPFTLIGYDAGDYYGPATALPTSYSGSISLGDNKGFQMGTSSLGELKGSGDGLLGVFSFKVVDTFDSPLYFLVDRFLPQFTQWEIDTTDGVGFKVNILVFMTNLPQPEKPITSDFNRNGVVDFDDFFAFANVFGRKQNVDPDYDRRFDLVFDGIIDLDDFFLFASHFGKAPVPID